MTNPNQISFNIGEEEIHMVFHNASLNAMSSVMFGDQSKANDIQAILSELNKINVENFWFAAKIVIYSGVVGYYMESDLPRPKYTFAQIGKLVGEMTQEELIEYTGKVWGKFLDDIGVNLEAIKKQESEDEGEKKK